MPFVKIPTGTAVSNYEWEGGLIVPWSTTLTETIGLGLMAEFDYVYNEHLILDFGVQGGLNRNSEDFGLFTGFTKRF